MALGNGTITVKWTDTVIVTYIPLSHFVALLDELRDSVVQFQPWPILVMQDFNVKTTSWGSRKTDVKGKAVGEWANSLDLRLINRGNTSTCVRWNEESIIDLTWASPSAANRITD